jgi:hypothetical protein
MTIVTFDVRSLADSLGDFARVWRTGQGDPAPRISFATPELLWEVLTAKAVHGDVQALLVGGILTKTADGKIQFPSEGIHVDFILSAA